MIKVIPKKYHRTVHVGWSEGYTDDDKHMKNLSVLENAEEVIISEKMDGEATTMYPLYDRGGIHARSVDSNVDWTREWCRSLQISLVEHIRGLRVCGENMAAIHSIEYDNLTSFFYLYSIFDHETNMCWSWDDTAAFAEKHDLAMPKVLYRGKWNAALFEKMFKNLDKEKSEGYVIRLASSFHYDDAHLSLCKAVRKGHVQTDEHWKKNAQKAKIADPNNIKPFSMMKSN